MVDLTAYVETLQGKPVAIFGLGLSGLSCVKNLIKAGVDVTAFDDNPENCEKVSALGASIDDLTKADLSGFAHLVLAPGVPYSFEPHDVVLNAQKYELEIIGDLEILHRCNHGVQTIGVTGTNGKSTTTALCAHVLNECGVVTVMGGNIGVPVLDLDLRNQKALVVEISSYQMDLCPTFRPDISVVLNITPDHLDRHGGMDEYIAAKAKILDGEGVAVVAVDDDYTQHLFDQTFINGIRKVIPVSVNSEIVEGYFVHDDLLKRNHGGENIYIDQLTGFDNLKGHHNQQNAACVYAITKEFNIEDADIIEAFRSYSGLPHRQYLIAEKNTVSYINDSKATNAESAAKALASYDNIYWIVGGRAKETGLQGLEIFNDKITKAYLIGESTADFALWMRDKGIAFELCGTIDKAVQDAHRDGQDNSPSTVLLSPAAASWDQFKSFEHRGDEFTKLVETCLAE